MNCWKLLGIEPTTSTLAIKKAYSVLLRSCNPEDKPEEFKALRKAYQSALKESRNVDVKDFVAADLVNELSDTQEKSLSYQSVALKDITEIDKLVQALETLYQDTQQRVLVEVWDALFKQDVFWNVEFAQTAKLATIRFLVECPNLPAEIISLASHSLNFFEDHAQLMSGENRATAEKFTVIINTAHLRFGYQSLLGIDCSFVELESHLHLRRQFEDILIFDEVDLNTLEALLEKRQIKFLTDVSMDQSLAQQYLNQYQFDKSSALVEKLIERHSNIDLLNMLAGMKLDSKEVSRAHELYRSALTIEPNNITATKGIGLCFYHEQQYSIAISILEQLEEYAFSDIELKTYLIKARAQRYQELEQQASPNNLEERAEILLGLKRFEECYWLFGELPEKVTGLKRFFTKEEQEPESIRLLRARSAENFGYKGFAVKVYCEVIGERLKNKEGIIDVLKNMLLNCSYKLSAEQVEESVIDHLDDLAKAARANGAIDPDYWLAVGLAHFRVTRKLTLSDEQRRKHDDLTIFAFNQLVALRPHSAFYHWQRGYVFEILQQYEQSIVSNQIAKRALMYNHNINLIIGRAYRNLKQYDEALEAFSHEMSLMNNDTQRSKVYEQIALTHLDMQNYKKAITAFESYQSLNETNYMEDRLMQSKLYFLVEHNDKKRQAYSQNLLKWHEDAIYEMQSHPDYLEKHSKTSEFIEGVERIVIITKRDFPSKAAPYEHLLKKIN